MRVIPQIIKCLFGIIILFQSMVLGAHMTHGITVQCPVVVLLITNTDPDIVTNQNQPVEGLVVLVPQSSIRYVIPLLVQVFCYNITINSLYLMYND